MIKENILAIPSKGRIKDETLDLLSDAGVKIEIPGRQLTATGTIPKFGEFTLALMRPKDIVSQVATGNIPVGISGRDTVREYRLRPNQKRYDEDRTTTLLRLGVGQCRLVLAAPTELGLLSKKEIREGSDRFRIPEYQLSGMTIGTSYPRLVNYYFADLDASLDTWTSLKYDILTLDGAVESAPALGLCDVIADLVETGASLKDNNLEELFTMFKSEAVLIARESYRGNNQFVDSVEDALFKTLVKRNNPDALKKQAQENATLQASVAGISSWARRRL